MKINIKKAQPITHTLEVDDCFITIKDEIPDLKSLSLEKVESFYKDEAKLIFTALKNSLPQGTRHALLIEILKNHQNFYCGL